MPEAVTTEEAQKQAEEQTVRQMQQQLEEQRLQEEEEQAPTQTAAKKVKSHILTKIIVPTVLTSGTALWAAFS